MLLLSVGKNKVMVVGWEMVASLVEIEMSSRIMEVVSPFRYLSTLFSVCRYPQEQVKVRVVVGLKTLGAIKYICNVRSVSLGVKYMCSVRSVSLGVKVPTVMY